ncbi:WD40/YVTN/BNR-like repeat-containing protein [Leptolyngbyaceae cyanobacterium UHCC 1019]
MSIQLQQHQPSILAVVIVCITFSFTGCTNIQLSSGCSLSSLPTTTQFNPALVSSEATSRVQSGSYTWNNVAIAGMGFVTGLVIHPKERDLIYTRTDVGGVYRWNAATSSWVQLMDKQRDRYNIESIALDPSNPNVIYAATGAYTRDANGDVLKSINRGATWTLTNLRTSAGARLRMGGNEEWRWAGERLAVDPNNSQIVYFGSRLDGLYRSDDGAKSWQPVESFPSKGTQGGIAFVVFDPRSRQGDRSSKTGSQVLYAGVMGQGVYRSEDGGKTWSLLADGPDSSQNPQQAMIAADGTVYITFFTTPSNPQGSVWKYQAGIWAQITPQSGKNYSAIAGYAQDPKTVMVATYPFTPEGLYRSTDGGTQWQSIKPNVEAVKWWPKWHLYTLTGGLAINPYQPKQVWLTTGFGVMRTDDITTSASQWCTYMNNLEELVVFVVKSPPVAGESHLFSGVADMQGFRHESLSSIPSQTYDNGKFSDTTGIDFSEADPKIIVRVGSFPGKGGREDSQGQGAYSSNNGQTWDSFINLPVGAANGKVAVSATLQANGKPIIVWAPQGDVFPQRSLDGGKTWLSMQNAPNQTTAQLWFSNQPIASDRVDGELFYLYKYSDRPNQGAFYRSTNSGATWQKTVTGLPNFYLHSVKAVPGMRGEVWLSIHNNRLYRSSDAGLSFTKLAQIQQANEVAFGKPAPGHQNPSTFVYGTINGVEGLFRSDDATMLPGDAAKAKWIKISSDQQRLSNINFLEGDRLIFGRVYLGTGGRGILYGDLGNLNIRH